MINPMEIKDITGSVKDVDVKGKIITGYLSKFGNVDHDGDIIEKGAFRKSLMERGSEIFFLNQHMWNQPHGKFKVLQEDNEGLYFESNPLVNTSYSMDAMKLYEAGIVKEHSIGFRTIKADFDSQDVRIIKEVKLFEGSNVTLGANSNTPFLGFKSGIKDINDQASLIYKAIRNGTFTDETFQLLEIALKQLQLQAYELGKKDKALDTEPDISTHNQIEPQVKTIKEFIKTIETWKIN